MPGSELAVVLAQGIAGEIAKLSKGRRSDPEGPASPGRASSEGREEAASTPETDYLAEYDRRVKDPDLRAATRSRFVSEHYADAVESGVKVLNEVVRKRTGRTEDGDELMAAVFNPKGALLRINSLRSKNEQSAQRGHLLLCQGVVAAWRNPRAHALTEDSPSRVIMMLELIDELIQVTKSATRTRKRK
jgi:uncharacterized protein (TIGR02391 family)